MIQTDDNQSYFSVLFRFSVLFSVVYYPKHSDYDHPRHIAENEREKYSDYDRPRHITGEG